MDILIKLNRKVIEEANEFIEENSIEELGDLMEVLNAIMKLKGYKLEEVFTCSRPKRERSFVTMQFTFPASTSSIMR